jgi:hypothetical protein
MDTDNHGPIEPIPEFDSYIELGEFWDFHSLADYWDQTKEAQVEFAPVHPQVKPTLFGSIQAGDITDEMIGEAKKDLFRELDDL